MRAWERVGEGASADRGGECIQKAVMSGVKAKLQRCCFCPPSVYQGREKQRIVTHAVIKDCVPISSGW